MHTTSQHDQQIYWDICPSHNLVPASHWWRNSHQVYIANWPLLHQNSFWEVQKIEAWKLHIWTVWWMLWHFPSISVKLQFGHLDCVRCCTFTENEPHQLLSSKSIFKPIRSVVAVSTASSPGINLGISKILLLQEWSTGYTWCTFLC